MRQLLLLPAGRGSRPGHPGAGRCRPAAGFRLRPPSRPAEAADFSEADEKLLAGLYALRKSLAAKQKIPAYLVFSDATLREMVEKKPLSVEELLGITGVGEKKAARYGRLFLSAIEDAVGSR